MKHSILSFVFFLSVVAVWADNLRVDMPLRLLGRDYVIATRVENVSTPVGLGKMKYYAGLRVYNPQLVRFTLEADSLVMTADDAKRGPQRVAMPVVGKDDEVVTAEMAGLFTSILRGVDIISGRLQPGVLNKDATTISMHKGDATHLEVSVNYEYSTDSVPFRTTVRKSLLLLSDTPMKTRNVDSRIGYKSNDNKNINRFRLSDNAGAITFYVSDEFPELWQTAIKQGIEDWNIAFARIGKPSVMKAVRYSEAGDGFDPFDITNNCFYNVESDFANAMGSHWTDPRSGEILQADVQFYSGVTEKLKTWLLLQTGAYNKDVADGNVPDNVMKRMIRYAVAHEIGHCLGLEHNYRASYAYPTDSLRSAAFCSRNGTTPSIMDYARFNYVAQPGDGVDMVYPPILGDYDIYAIEAGYRDFPTDAEYKAFIDSHQQDDRYCYTKMKISAVPNDVKVQQSDLGNDALKSTQYGISNIAALPQSVLRNVRAEDVQGFYFQLLMHLVPELKKDEVREYVEEQLTTGFGILNTQKMREVYGDQGEQIDHRRAEFMHRVGREYALNVPADPMSTGMWMPHQIVSDDVYSLLKQDGVRLSKEQIYSINKRCASGAALSLSTDNGVASPYATASFVSKDGLVLTNFHCVSSAVQRLGNGRNDYMRYGCWSTRREEEAPLFGLELHQLLFVEDVTEQVFAGTEGLSEEEREKVVDKQARALMDNSTVGYGRTLRVYSLMGGRQYVRACYRTYRDVRIVACPPMWLGAYGGDDDNWRWPRYSCDFAFLRVYASADGETTDYAKDNVPYHPQSWLKVAKNAVSEGDMTMVMGFPGQTRKNIPAFALDKIVNRDTQLRANALKAKIDYLRECSKKATGTALSGYNVRINKMMNVYLRSKGEIDGVRNSGLVDVKRKEDLALQEWINADADRMARYGSNLIQQMDSVYAKVTLYNHMDEAFSQFAGSGAGIIPFAGKFEKLINIDRSKRKSRRESMENEIPEVQRNIREFFPSISMSEDCGMMKTLLPLYLKAVPKEYLPKGLRGKVDMDQLYATSLLTDSARLEKMLAQCLDTVGVKEVTLTQLSEDPLYRICLDIYTNRVQKQMREATPLRRLNTKLYGVYMRAKAEKDAGKLYPFDGNHTLRFSPGRVKSVNHITDMLQRNDSTSQKFRTLLATLANGKKDASHKKGASSAAHGKKGASPIACFTTSSETSAGNSGSAVINAKGELVGLNFDRTIDSASSIYRFDPLLMRNIAVSTDYILWVIENLSYSQHILKELR